MEFLAIALIAAVLTKSVSDARIDHTYAKQGLVSPRLEAKYGGSARERTSRYGYTDYLKDAWSDHWQCRAAALEADREARLANPKRRVPFRERLASAKTVMGSAYRKLVDPVEAPAVERVEPATEPVLAVDTGDVPVGTVRHTDDGPEWWNGSRWVVPARPRPVVRASAPVPEPDTPPARPVVIPDPEPDMPAVDTATAPTTGGPAMTAPTGEAVNYETTIAELEAQAAELREHVDHCQQAKDHIEAAKGSISDMQDSYRATSAAAGLTAEHLEVKHLDDTTMANAGTVVDALPDGVVDTWFDQLEEMEQTAKERLEAAEAALGAVETNLAHITAQHGDSASNVAENLSGDPSFLGSGDGSSTTTTREPVAV